MNKFFLLSVLLMAAGCGDSKDTKPSEKPGLPPGTVELLGRNGSAITADAAALRAALSTVNADQNSAQVTSTENQIVEVSIGDLQNALALSLRNQNRFFDELFINGDGSVTFNRPRFLFAGQQRVIGSGNESPMGSCRHFGFSAIRIYNFTPCRSNVCAEWIVQRETRFVMLNSQGNLSSEGRISYEREGWGMDVINSVTCGD